MIYENIIHGQEQEILGEYGVMFPDGRYFIVDTHSCQIFVDLFCRKLITEEEMDKYNELIGMDGGRIVDFEKNNNMWKNLIEAGFIQIQGRYITGAKLFYKEINKEQRDTFQRMGIKIDESKQFILAKD